MHLYISRMWDYFKTHSITRLLQKSSECIKSFIGCDVDLSFLRLTLQPHALIWRYIIRSWRDGECICKFPLLSYTGTMWCKALLFLPTRNCFAYFREIVKSVAISLFFSSHYDTQCSWHYVEGKVRSSWQNNRLIFTPPTSIKMIR